MTRVCVQRESCSSKIKCAVLKRITVQYLLLSAFALQNNDKDIAVMVCWGGGLGDLELFRAKMCT